MRFVALRMVYINLTVITLLQSPEKKMIQKCSSYFPRNQL